MNGLPAVVAKRREQMLRSRLLNAFGVIFDELGVEEVVAGPLRIA
jgi:hypothetical protein